MCLTCNDKSSTNPDLCGIARAARKEEAAHIVSLYQVEGLRFAEIAEQLETSPARARKLYYEGLEIVDRDKRKIAESVISHLEEEIQEARRDLKTLADDPIERYKAREHLYKLYDRLMRYTGAIPPTETVVKNGIALPEPPDDQELMDIYNQWKGKNS